MRKCVLRTVDRKRGRAVDTGVRSAVHKESLSSLRAIAVLRSASEFNRIVQQSMFHSCSLCTVCRQHRVFVVILFVKSADCTVYNLTFSLVGDSISSSRVASVFVHMAAQKFRKFSAVEDQKLVASVMKYPILYNHEGFTSRNVQLMREGWQAVSAELGISGKIAIFSVGTKSRFG